MAKDATEFRDMVTKQAKQYQKTRKIQQQQSKLNSDTSDSTVP